MSGMTTAATQAALPATIPASAPADPDRKGPGRPRSAKADEAIISSVVGLLLEGTAAESLSIEAVATRAGVGKATIYRRWPNKDALLLDAVASLKGPLPEIAGERVYDDLLTLLRPIGLQTMARASTVLPCLISELKRSPLLNECYQKVTEPRRELMRSVLRRGIANGELRPDLDLEVVMAILVGPVLVQTILNWNPNLNRDGLAERVVASVWPAIAATPTP
jgi:AcrR family transcriptional regulator